MTLGRRVRSSCRVSSVHPVLQGGQGPGGRGDVALEVTPDVLVPCP